MSKVAIPSPAQQRDMIKEHQRGASKKIASLQKPPPPPPPPPPPRPRT